MASLHQGVHARGACSAWRSRLSLPRRAVEVVELEVRGQTLLKPLPTGESLLPEPKPWGAPLGSLQWESGLPLWGTSLHYHLPFLTSMGSSLCPTGDSSSSPVPKRVGLLHISRVLSEVFGDRLAGGSQGTQDTFPLQQKVLLCSLLLLARHSHVREVTLGKVSVSSALSGLDLGSGWVSLGCLLGSLLWCNPPLPSPAP